MVKSKTIQSPNPIMIPLLILRLNLMGLDQGNEEHGLRDVTLNTKPTQNSIGIIFGNISTTQFKFAISGANVKRTGYTQVWHDDHGWVLGQIMELNLESNLSYSKAQELSHEHMISTLCVPGQPSRDQVISNEEQKNGKLTGFVNIIGFRDRQGIIQLPSSPLNAGQPVFPATGNLIKYVLGLEVNKRLGTYIGLLRNHNLKVHLDINSLVQKHISVIAKTGSGKSYIVGVLVEELIKRKVPVVIIDPHGEYSTLMHPNINEHDTRLMSKYGVKPRGYPDAIREYSLNPKINLGTIPLKMSSYGFTPETISELLGLRSSGIQTAILYKALNRIISKKNIFTLRELSAVIELDRNSAKWHLINSLGNLQATGIFSDDPTRLTELAQTARTTIINLRGISPQQQQIVVTQLTRQLFEARKLNKIPPLMLILEEAHQFCPQQGRAQSSNVLRTIASEGRKFGLGLCVVSQRPSLVDKNVLSQCNTQVILKVTNPNDLKAVIASVEGLTTSVIDEIQRLPISVAIVVGGGVQVPIFIDVRVRETKHGGRPVDIFSDVDTFHINQPLQELEKAKQDLHRTEIDQNIVENTINKRDIPESDLFSVSEHLAELPDEKKFSDFFKDNQDNDRDNNIESKHTCPSRKRNIKSAR